MDAFDDSITFIHVVEVPECLRECVCVRESECSFMCVHVYMCECVYV